MNIPRGRTGKGDRRTPPETFDIVRAVIRKISFQFPDCPEGRFMLAVIAVALNDLITNRHGGEYEIYREAAARYLQGDIWHAHIAGVDPEWIRAQLTKAGIDFSGSRP
jgi:hypothetical protein